MASMFLPFTTRIPVVAFLYLLIICCFYGRGEDVESGGVGGFEDPPEIVAKALLCFNDKYIYSGCEESCRLKESGNIEVPMEKTDEYCNGPCLEETHLVLDCIDGIFRNFLFFNRATLEDVRATILAGCGYGPQRGHFNVAEHINAEIGKACRLSKEIWFGLGFFILGLFNLLL